MWQEKRVAKEEVVKPRYREHDVSALADVVLADLGLTTQICNRFYASLSRNQQQQAQQQVQRPQPPPPPPEVPSPAPRAQSNQEPLSHLRDLRSRWELRLCAAVAKASEKARGPLPATCHLPPATCYLLPATCYRTPATTCHLLLSTCSCCSLFCLLTRTKLLNHSPAGGAATYYLLHTSYFLLPTAYRRGCR